MWALLVLLESYCAVEAGECANRWWREEWRQELKVTSRLFHWHVIVTNVNLEWRKSRIEFVSCGYSGWGHIAQKYDLYLIKNHMKGAYI